MRDIDKELDEIRAIFHRLGLNYSEVSDGDKLLSSYVSMGIPEFNQALQAIKQLINQARIDELKRWEAPENEIMMTFADPCIICGFNYKTLRQAQQDRLKELQEE